MARYLEKLSSYVCMCVYIERPFQKPSPISPRFGKAYEKITVFALNHPHAHYGKMIINKRIYFFSIHILYHVKLSSSLTCHKDGMIKTSCSLNDGRVGKGPGTYLYKRCYIFYLLQGLTSSQVSLIYTQLVVSDHKWKTVNILCSLQKRYGRMLFPQ